MSFKEALDMTGLPLVTFRCGNRKISMLFDTGSDCSYINKGIIDELPHKVMDMKSSTVDASGGVDETPFCMLDISYNGNDFTEVFGIKDLSQAFEVFYKEHGIHLNGILGSRFFERYKYVLDFKNLIAYIS